MKVSVILAHNPTRCLAIQTTASFNTVRWANQLAYGAGQRPPNYPMPATMTNAHWARHIEWIEDCYWWEQANEKAYLMFGRRNHE